MFKWVELQTSVYIMIFVQKCIKHQIMKIARHIMLSDKTELTQQVKYINC